MSSKLSTYANLIVRFEEELKNIEKNIADDGKKLVIFSESLATEFKGVAEEVFNQISKEVEKNTNDKINELSKKFSEERDKKITEIKNKGQKNMEKATDFVLKKIEEVFK
ncbi:MULTISPECIES: hypothetical protein [Sulfurisphaera]|uniref:Uncharacterized protein n=2 Tax=Sulfurisphaera tokodaii TaxID=111955 RepID=Q975Q1_SULTO|nr:hypothetical protein [Sulfurisphaera tokodaii]BAB65349.1 hypothetical protein STK_03690 [Sulfurisphaera tokodaii str. 7]HII74952.1 hypothetical protein [Sulfurisphaera tokodaii]